MSPEALRPETAALFLDVDGTLLDFAPSPELVFLPEGLLDDIANLNRNLNGAMALVSGRTIAELDRLFDPLRLSASGVHGAEMRYEPAAQPPEVEGAANLSSELWIALNAMLAEFPGTFAENKRFSFAVHYRAAPLSGAYLRERLKSFIEETGGGLELIEAHFAFELKAGFFDKGAAIEKFLERPPFSGRVPVFIGDDFTDEAGFAAVARRGGAAYSVGLARPHVSGVFPGPAEVREWIAQAARESATS